METTTAWCEARVRGPATQHACQSAHSKLGPVMWQRWLEGSAGSSGTTYVDVRDVARAHVLAAEVPSARGRYILSHTHGASAAEIAKWLQEAFPEWDLPSGEEGGGKPTCANSKAAKDLGLTLTPLRETFLDMARTLVQLGIATPKSR